jgi:tRNA modification GTPase
MFSAHELIVAPATASGPGARAIVRLAGDGLDGLLPRLFTAAAPGFAPPGGTARVVAARLAGDGLGREWGAVPVEVLHWPGDSGPIGGPLAEVQLPCSAPLVAAVVAEACRHGARLARGGEFTLRAFLAGRLDLLQAEAVLAVVDARTPAELAAALDRMAGGAGAALSGVRGGLLDLLADVEAAIDFADETAPDGVPVAAAAGRHAVASRLEAGRDTIAVVARHLQDRGAGAGDVPRVVLVGRPNVGKSSLFNALVGRAAALVADESGTTRDFLEAPLAGVGGLLVDLAGVSAQPVDDAVGKAAIATARDQIARADVLVVCRDATDEDGPADVPPTVPRIDVLTRCDRAPAWPAHADAIATSVATGQGIEPLRAAIHAAVAGLPPRGTAATLRMAVGVAAARAALEAALALARRADESFDEALIAGHVRQAVDRLGEVTGVSIGTDLIDRIFSRHCIGK